MLTNSSILAAGAALLAFSSIALTGFSVEASNREVMKLRPGQSVTAYQAINLSGKVCLEITSAATGMPASAKFWRNNANWLGRNDHYGRKTGIFCRSFTGQMKLRVGAAKEDLIIRIISEDVKPFIGFPSLERNRPT
jgi:hypothetical protein